MNRYYAAILIAFFYSHVAEATQLRNPFFYPSSPALAESNEPEIVDLSRTCDEPCAEKKDQQPICRKERWSIVQSFDNKVVVQDDAGDMRTITVPR